MSINIPFNKSPIVGSEHELIRASMDSSKLVGDGFFSKKAEELLEELCDTPRAILTPSCTSALELAAILLDIEPGDEVVMPSYTFVSTATAFVLRGAKIVFVDVEQETMNLDSMLIEQAVTSKTKAIVPVHYAGVSCNMDEIMAIAGRHNLFVVEDAAQGVGSRYKGRPLGSIGHMGAFSFHGTKNITSGGEGGALLVNDDRFIERAEIIREKGTNRKKFFRGEIDKYTWVDVGSSFLLSEIQAAFLCAQLEGLTTINDRRMQLWQQYQHALHELEQNGIQIPFIPENCAHNAHMFYLKCKDLHERSALIAHCRDRGIAAVFHYIPLHSSPAGKQFGEFSGMDRHTTLESEKILRLPLYYGLSDSDQELVIEAVTSFYR